MQPKLAITIGFHIFIEFNIAEQWMLPYEIFQLFCKNLSPYGRLSLDLYLQDNKESAYALGPVKFPF